MVRRIFAIVSIAAMALAGATAFGQVPRAAIDCQSYAAVAARIAEYREVGAPLPMVLEFLRLGHPHGPVLVAVEREAKRVYAESLAPDEAAYKAYQRCQAVLGTFGVEG